MKNVVLVSGKPSNRPEVLIVNVVLQRNAAEPLKNSNARAGELAR